MGLDQYLYSTTKKNREDADAYEKLCKLFHDKSKELFNGKYNGFKGFPQGKFGNYLYSEFTDEQHKQAFDYYQELKKLATDLGYDEDKEISPGDELCYWRRCWCLHKLIKKSLDGKKKMTTWSGCILIKNRSKKFWQIFQN